MSQQNTAETEAVMDPRVGRSPGLIDTTGPGPGQPAIHTESNPPPQQRFLPPGTFPSNSSVDSAQRPPVHSSPQQDYPGEPSISNNSFSI